MEKNIKAMEKNLALSDEFITKELQKFEIKEADLRELATKYAGLSVKDHTDKEGLEKVYQARQELKSVRVEIGKKGKALRASALAFQRAVIAREDELIQLIEPTEKYLKAEEDRIAKIKQEIREEEERKEVARVQGMIDKLSAVEYAVDWNQLRGMTDEQFEVLLQEATEQYELVKKQRAEEERVQKEKAEQEERERKAEAERLEKVRLEQQARQRELDEKERKQQEEAKRIQEERDKIRQQKMDARIQRCRSAGMVWNGITWGFTPVLSTDESVLEVHLTLQNLDELGEAEFEKAINTAVHGKKEEDRLAEEKRQRDIATARQEAEEKARQEERERQEREKREQEEKAAREKEEAEERLRVGSDKERWHYLANSLEDILNDDVWNHFRSKKGKYVAGRVHDTILSAHKDCKNLIE